MSKQSLNTAIQRAATHTAKRVREQGIPRTDLLTRPKIQRLTQSLTEALASDYPLHAEGLQEALLHAVYNDLMWNPPLREPKDD